MNQTQEFSNKVAQLVGKIGRNNLTTNSKNRIAEFNEQLGNIKSTQHAINEAEEEDKEPFEDALQVQIEDAIEMGETLVEFLEIELADIEATRKKFEKQKEADAQAKADADAKAKADAEAQAQADGQQSETNQTTPATETHQAVPVEKKGSSMTTLLVGGFILVATLGAINLMGRNR